jgi:small subunit ribosomal protein S16
MVRIRLMRVGKKKQPSYRVVVADSRSPRDGRIIESIGHYAPREEPSVIAIDSDRAVHWLQRGAQPSDQAKKLMQISGAWQAFTGEAPPAPTGAAASAAPGAAPAAKSAARKRATPAASVAEGEGTNGEDVAELPEAVDQAAAAPDNEPAGDTAAEAVEETK